MMIWVICASTTVLRIPWGSASVCLNSQLDFAPRSTLPVLNCAPNVRVNMKLLMCGFILKMILLQPCRSTSKKSEGNMCLALHGQRLAKFWCSLTAASERIEVCCCFTTVNPSGLSRPTFAPHIGAEHSVFLISSHFKNCKTVKGVGTLPSILKMPARS